MNKKEFEGKYKRIGLGERVFWGFMGFFFSFVFVGMIVMIVKGQDKTGGAWVLFIIPILVVSLASLHMAFCGRENDTMFG